jgi:alkylated DNA repair dioxygenase AlkB
MIKISPMAYLTAPNGTPLATDEEGYIKVHFIEPLPRIINQDGAVVRYDAGWIDSDRASILLDELKTYEPHAENAEGWIHGKYFVSERRTLQIADPGVRAYKFTGSTATEPEPFSNYPIISGLRDEIFTRLGVRCNFCLYNAYTPDAKLGWHSDSEEDMVPGSVIVSLSFGDVRRFRIRHKSTKKITDIYLNPGSILTMERKCQQVMDHCVWDINQKEMANIVHSLRINLTFRKMRPSDREN